MEDPANKQLRRRLEGENRGVLTRLWAFLTAPGAESAGLG